LNKLIEANNDRNSHPSSINGDAYEALVGAIYLDKGFDFARNFMLTRIINVHIDMNEVETKEVDFKSKFIEWAQKEKKDFRFDIVSDGNAAADKQFMLNLIVDDKVIGTAQHFSKKRAEQLAAEQACAELGI
jgi:ribonuclease III